MRSTFALLTHSTTPPRRDQLPSMLEVATSSLVLIPIRVVGISHLSMIVALPGPDSLLPFERVTL